MKKTIVTLLALSVAGMCLAGCGSDTTSTEEASSAEVAEETGEDEAVPAFPAEYDGCTLDVTLTEVDGDYVIAYGTYTNDNEDPLYASCSFGLKAFQGGVSLEDVSDINGDEASLIKEVKDGASVDVSYKFKLDNDEDEIEIMAVTPTADQDVLAEIFLSPTAEE